MRKCLQKDIPTANKLERLVGNLLLNQQEMGFKICKCKNKKRKGFAILVITISGGGRLSEEQKVLIFMVINEIRSQYDLTTKITDERRSRIECSLAAT